jgi:ferritin-like metal-binding protein YciE
VGELDGEWVVERAGGALPPMTRVEKRISGDSGETIVAGVARFPFDVRGRELHYRLPLAGLVDQLEPANGGFAGRATVAGREIGRFRMRRPGGDMAEQTLRDQLTKHIDEAIAMEANDLRMLDSIIRTTDDLEVVAIFREHRLETERQLDRLRRRLDAYDASPSVVREAGGLLGVLTKGVLDVARGEKAGRNARDAYATEHMEIASYELLERIAIRAGDEETAQVARENRQGEREMARRIEEHWDEFVELSLAEAGVTTASASTTS